MYKLKMAKCCFSRLIVKYFTLFVETYFETAKLQITEAFILKKTDCKATKKREWETALKSRSDNTVKKSKELFQGIKTNKLNPFHFLIEFQKNKIWKKHVQQFLVEVNDVLKDT